MLDPTAQQFSIRSSPASVENRSPDRSPPTACELTPDVSRRQFLAASSVALLPHSTLLSGINLAAATLPAAVAPATAALATAASFNPATIIQRSVLTSFLWMPSDRLPDAISRDMISSGEPSVLHWFISESIRTVRNTDAHNDTMSSLAQRITNDNLSILDREIFPGLHKLARGFREQCMSAGWVESEEGKRAFGAARWFLSSEIKNGEQSPELSAENLWQIAREQWISKKVLSEVAGSIWNNNWFTNAISEQLKPSAFFLAQNLPRSGLIAREAVSRTIFGPSLKLQVNALTQVIRDANTPLTLRNLNERFTVEQQLDNRRAREEARAERMAQREATVREHELNRLRLERLRLESNFDGLSGSADEFYENRQAIQALQTPRKLS